MQDILVHGRGSLHAGRSIVFDSGGIVQPCKSDATEAARFSIWRTRHSPIAVPARAAYPGVVDSKLSKDDHPMKPSLLQPSLFRGKSLLRTRPDALQDERLDGTGQHGSYLSVSPISDGQL